ncbi:Leucyl aminopeptidase yscIV [Friedmanniomyces endolithicus]|nr:Leucyl aminopeptidase yscIV [Friedmanniomyces endolithicus]KAK0992937.1 Leucyl aminopeptidase yscIV [Friedmanniomyces endolithicus]
MVIRPASASVAKTGAAGMHQRRDPNTLANYNEWMTTDTTADFTIDFDAKRLKGTVHLTLENLAKDSRQIILDTSFLEVSSVRANDETAEYQLAASRVEPYGTPLTISLPARTDSSKSNVTLSIDVATTKDCTALQWLTPAQTSNKKHPYLFSQCQAIHARSLFPCQDTPDVKSTFTFNIRSPLPVLASGLPTGPKDFQPGEDGKSGTLLYTFHQSIPMPSYLFALASGDIASASIGPRSTVWTGPEELTASQWEFEKDTEAYIQAAEKIVYPYAWTTYNVLVLPPSFPYGGMENPVYTFATPTVVSGDRQNVDVIAHELSHSWSGNLVSNASWEHFWLNEGWTEYLERRIIAAVHGSDQYRDFSAIIGWKALEDSIAQFGEDHNFTKLIPDLNGKDPDDAFSSVPYEKGFVFLYHFEKLLGTEKWDKFIPHYFTTFKQKSVDSYEFKATLLDFFANDVDAAKKLQNALAENHKEGDFKPSAKDIESWTANQSVVFLERLQSLAHHPITPDLINLMGSSYGYESSKNVELVSRFYTLGLMSRAESVYKPTAELLGKVGRMKFVRPLYRQLIMRDRKLAERTFEENRDFYHPICRGMVEKLFEKHA